MIEIDGHWSAIDIDRDSKVIIALPRGERPLPGLLSASPSTLPSSGSSCHRRPSWKTGSRQNESGIEMCQSLSRRRLSRLETSDRWVS